MPGSSSSPLSPEDFRRKELILCGFSVLDEIVSTVKISAAQWRHMEAVNSGISSDSQNISARLL